MNHTNGFYICHEDRMSLLYSHSGISGLNDTLGALLNGASLHAWDVQQDIVAGLADWLITDEITIYRSSVTVYRSFIAALDGSKRFPKIRLVYLWNEPVPKREVDLYIQYFSSDCTLFNGIGSTETQSFCNYYIDRDIQIPGQSGPVGFVTEGYEVMLLDEDGKAVGLNQIGEIAVRSPYLSPGYWRGPDLT